MNIVTIKIEAQSTSVDTFKALLGDLIEQVENEVVEGSLRHSDGDCVAWSVVTKETEV